jgi:hypothetical protein
LHYDKAIWLIPFKLQAYAGAGNLSELKPSSTKPAMPHIVDPWTYLRTIITVSLESESIVKILDFAEIFLYTNNERSAQAANFFAVLVQHVLNILSGGPRTTAPTHTSTNLPSAIKSYRIVDVNKLKYNDKIAWNNLPDDIRFYLSSYCLQTLKIQLAQYKHKQLKDFVKRLRLPVTYTFIQENRYWCVDLIKTESVSYESGGMNMCSCLPNIYCYSSSIKSRGPCQASILNPNHPLEKLKDPTVVQPKIDQEQVKSLLVHFQNVANGLEIESEIEIVEPPERNVTIVEMLD